MDFIGGALESLQVLAIGGMEAETADGTTGAETGGRGDFTHTLRYSYTSTTVLQAQDDAGAIIDAEVTHSLFLGTNHIHSFVYDSFLTKSAWVLLAPEKENALAYI